MWLEVLSEDFVLIADHRRVLCRCVCGVVKYVIISKLKSGRAKSCGCMRGIKHRQADSLAYASWANMKARCRNPNNPYYHKYGGAGVDFPDRWLIFTEFHKDMGDRPAGTTLDRIDNTKGYAPDNCRWADRKTQQNNTRRSIKIRHNGTTYTVWEIAQLLKVSDETVRRAYHNGTLQTRLGRV